MKRPGVIIFDVNETLLDLSPLKKSINSALKNEQASETWFAQLLHYSLVETVKGTYSDFSEIAAAVFKMSAEKYDLAFTESQIKDILSPVSALKPYKDVVPALRKLKPEGAELVAFSNGKPDVLQDQLEFAEIDHFFSRILSVEACKKYKPHPDAYKYALKELNCSASDAMMVAAHGWDIAGAQEVGMKTAFVERPGKKLYPLASEPDFVLKKLTGLVGVISETGYQH
ncbi:haloacid dehalogenase type II [Gramella jeungdoensis]|uniref:Haloacid dehalogenase type II n=1 Tax=Gramella jeungdoensis TaxID=708091 RepID=A0ABT0Z269_9FLAO|nr:haloacid dehalogenase type II [Gramella jeungdoensis]MCM8569822.1 haloacid dehalogenase type II [Gramella jeungdoensis]